MAKKKETPTPLDDNNVTLEVVNENAGEQPEVSNAPENSDKSAENLDNPPADEPVTTEVTEVKNKTVEVEIPDIVKAILKQYPNEKELHIDNWGGVFAKGTQPALVKNAILYKNPFYKK